MCFPKYTNAFSNFRQFTLCPRHPRGLPGPTNAQIPAGHRHLLPLCYLGQRPPQDGHVEAREPGEDCSLPEEKTPQGLVQQMELHMSTGIGADVSARHLLPQPDS